MNKRMTTILFLAGFLILIQGCEKNPDSGWQTYKGYWSPAKNVFGQNISTLRSSVESESWATTYAALAPYRKQLFMEATEKGYSVTRHPMLRYPNNRATLSPGALSHTANVFLFNNFS